jgi:hypothetical protein
VKTKDHYQEGQRQKKPKIVLGSDEETPSPGQSPKYHELNDNTFATDTDDVGMDVANIVLNHLVVVRSSQVRSTNYITYVHLIFS